MAQHRCQDGQVTETKRERTGSEEALPTRLSWSERPASTGQDGRHTEGNCMADRPKACPQHGANQHRLFRGKRWLMTTCRNLQSKTESGHCLNEEDRPKQVGDHTGTETVGWVSVCVSVSGVYTQLS